jgi:hypothetical protein
MMLKRHDLGMGPSDWIALGMLGVGAIMGTFGPTAVRILGVVIFLAAIVGWGISHNRESGTPPASPAPPQRRLSARERQVIVERLSQFKGTPIAAGASFGDDEAQAYRDDLVEALTAAGWAFDGHVGVGEIVPTPIGVGVRENQAEAEADRVPAAAAALIATLVDLHIMNRRPDGKLPLDIDPRVPADRFWLFVGKRPQ